jgi:hypothetical protein
MTQIIDTKRYRGNLKWMAISLPWAIIAIFVFPPAGAVLLVAIQIWLAILVFSIWYKAWQTIQDSHARTTPGKAIGYAFIPFFNVYWIFQMIWGFAVDFNRFADRYGHPVKHLPSTGIFVALVIGVLGIIPVLSIPCGIVGGTLYILIVITVVKRVNELGESIASQAAAPPALEEGVPA